MKPPEERYRAVRSVLLIELALNVLVASVKAALGLWTGSLAIVSDGFHSLTDGANNIVGLVVLGWAESPPDTNHPYGHRKYETIAAAVVGVAIGLVAVRLGWAAVEGLLYGNQKPDVSVLGFAILGGTLCINVFVAVYESRQAKLLDSEYLAADAAHTASDVLATCFVIASFGGAALGLPWADPVGALIVTAVIGRVAWVVLAASMAPLADSAVVNAQAVEKACMAIKGVRGCHRVRSRGTERFAYVDLHLLLDGDIPLRAAHDIAEEVERSLRATYPRIADVTIHMEPEEDGHEDL